jgi:DNA gyrase subunit B
MPDSLVFETIEFSQSAEIARMKQSAYLTPGVTFNLINKKTGYKGRFYFEGGIKTWLRNLVGEQERLGSQYYINMEGNNCLTEVAFQFVNTTNDYILSFANNIPTTDG